MIHQNLNLKDSRGRLFVVGDLHGNLDALVEAALAVGLSNEDHLFSVGDLVDRGHQNLELLRLFDCKPNFHAVRGNHEQMIVDNDIELHRLNGGRWLYDLDITEQDEVRAICQAMPTALTVQTPSGREVGIVHADVDGTDWSWFVSSLEEGYRSQQIAQWSRSGIEAAKSKGGAAAIENIDMVYMGHTPNGSPVRSRNQVWLDVAAWKTGKAYLEQIL